MDNAFKFSSRGQSVEIATKTVDGFWQLTVKDSGVGMDSKDIAQIGAYRQFQRKSREQQGSGLGRALTLVGLEHLRARGLTEAMLYVDADNEPAIGLYRGLGFAHWDTDRMYQRGPVPG